MGNYEDFEFRKFTGKSECDKALNTLNGILLGIELDHIINDLELRELENWCLKHTELISRNPFMEFQKRIREGIEDSGTRHGLVEDLLFLCNKFQENYIYFDAVTMDLQILQGIFHGVINEKEVLQLKGWLEEHEHLSSHYPYDDVYRIVCAVLEDGMIDADEHKMLLAYFNEFSRIVSPSIAISIRDEIKGVKISGICAVGHDISIDGKAFCFTGKSKIGLKSVIKEKIIDKGGVWHENLVSSTDYLVVGTDGNPAWAFSCYGRKVEAAVSLQRNVKNPGKVVILDEGDFARFMKELGVEF